MNLARIAELVEEVVLDVPHGELTEIHVTRADDNPQTDLDKRIDAYLTATLPRILDVPLMSEEDPGRVLGRSGLCWIVDPVDGTINVIAGAGEFAVCAALVDAKDLRSLVGVVHLPRTGQIFTAIHGEGARRNGRVLVKDEFVGAIAPRAQRIAAFGVPKDGPGVAARMAHALGGLYSAGWVTRQQGAASVDICQVATGSWAAFFEYGLMYWDFAAAALIATEAGCSVRAVPRGPSRPDLLPLEFDFVVTRTAELMEEVTAMVGIRPEATRGR
ncbi:inositol monophosphatase family protein [Acrocarpospora catenulata]|uniref:inositol monophosphatase family protein n=1 Tax=Acrocarpospora catenulata TaxID=2836182 RepID=UPI001BD96D40|nr:inositol monophosphatase family protein [Acrocarpospora catenulata]